MKPGEEGNESEPDEKIDAKAEAENMGLNKGQKTFFMDMIADQDQFKSNSELISVNKVQPLMDK